MPLAAIPEIGEHAKDVEQHDVLHGTGKHADFFGHSDPAAAADQVRGELNDAAGAKQFQGRPDFSEAYGGSNYTSPRGLMEARVFGRLTNSAERAKCVSICGALFILAAVEMAGFVIWWFASGPGRQQKPVPKDDIRDNVPQGPGTVVLDVLLNDQDCQGTAVQLVGANAQGSIVQAQTGTWTVAADNQVHFTPDALYDFKQPATVSYVLTLNGAQSLPAAVTIRYQSAPSMSDPDPQWQRADYTATATFDIGNASGKVVLVKPDATSPSTQTVKKAGVWTVTNTHTVTFQATADFNGAQMATDIQVDYGSSRSKPATLTVVFNQPQAAAVVVQDLTPRKPSPAIDVVIRSNAVAPHSLDRASVKLVGVRDMELGGYPDCVSLSTDGKKMVALGQGVWMVSDDGHVAFAPDLLGPNLVNTFVPGKDRNDYTGYAGLKFTSVADQTAARLGIRKPAGATGIWTVLLTEAQGTTLASAAIDLTNSTAGEVAYGACKVQLAKKTDYFLVTQVTQGGQLWPDQGPATLYSAVAVNAVSVCATTLAGLSTATGGEALSSFVGLDLTVDGFTGNPIPALYTVSDTSKNTSVPGVIILNYGTPVQPVAINDPDDTNFFNNLRQWVIDPNPPPPHARQLAILTVLANATMEMAGSPTSSPITDVDTRYKSYRTDPAVGGTSDLLSNICSDITPSSVDPHGAQPAMYARYWRLRTMQDLVYRLVEDLKLS
jgi:hypothetical protein